MAVALVVGSTGLIGNQLVEYLLKEEYYHQVIALSRTPLPFVNPKLKNVLADYQSLASNKEALVADDVFCCLGTTIKKAKSKDGFREIDFSYPLLVAKLTNASGAKQFLLVSALGAKKSSTVFYNQVKGEVEDAIRDVGFDAYHIFRPSLLLGPRLEQREGEKAMQKILHIIDFLIPKKYKAIESSKVANAMLSWAKQQAVGNHIHESDTLQNY